VRVRRVLHCRQVMIAIASHQLIARVAESPPPCVVLATARGGLPGLSCARTLPCVHRRTAQARVRAGVRAEAVGGARALYIVSLSRFGWGPGTRDGESRGPDGRSVSEGSLRCAAEPRSARRGADKIL
jgi:hypothetical protein